jgi:polyisoprenoid-binding protein YceI
MHSAYVAALRAILAVARASVVVALAAYGLPAICADDSSLAEASALPGQYRLDTLRSGVTFAVETLHSQLTMRFQRMDARLDGMQRGLETCHVFVTIDATSVAADLPFVAHAVKGKRMLNAERYPTIRFASTRFVRTGETSGLLTGNLTIRDTTRPITFRVVFDNASGHVLSDHPMLAFSADGHFSRAAFGLSSWLPAVGDDVHVKIKVQFLMSSRP